jgi:hypothetical protein
VYVKYNNDTEWRPVTDPATLPTGTNTAEYRVVDKDGRQTTTTTTITVVPTGPSVPPIQPNQTATPASPFTIPPVTGVTGPPPTTTTVTIFQQLSNGTLVPVITGLQPGDSLAPAQVAQLAQDPNAKYVTQYLLTNSGGSSITTAPLAVAPTPLVDPLPPLPPGGYVIPASNASGANNPPNPYAGLTGMNLVSYIHRQNLIVGLCNYLNQGLLTT